MTGQTAVPCQIRTSTVKWSQPQSDRAISRFFSDSDEKNNNTTTRRRRKQEERERESKREGAIKRDKEREGGVLSCLNLDSLIDSAN